MTTRFSSSSGHPGTRKSRKVQTLEKAQQLANHESARTTKLYDRRDDKLSLDEVEKISI